MLYEVITEFLALRCRVVRVENPGQILGVDLLLHGRVVIAGVELLDAERCDP